MPAILDADQSSGIQMVVVTRDQRDVRLDYILLAGAARDFEPFDGESTLP